MLASDLVSDITIDITFAGSQIISSYPFYLNMVTMAPPPSMALSTVSCNPKKEVP
jgi:hypothetical protein